MHVENFAWKLVWLLLSSGHRQAVLSMWDFSASIVISELLSGATIFEIYGIECCIMFFFEVLASDASRCRVH